MPAQSAFLEAISCQLIFIGFRLPAGEHYIELNFEPPGLRLGILINIMTLGLVGALWARYRRTQILLNVPSND